MQSWEMIIPEPTLEHVCRNGKEDERRNNAEGNAKRQRTSMELDTIGKRHSGRLKAKEIVTKESPEDRDTDDSVVDDEDDDVTMSESQATLPPVDRNSCRSSIKKTMDIF